MVVVGVTVGGGAAARPAVSGGLMHAPVSTRGGGGGGRGGGGWLDVARRAAPDKAKERNGEYSGMMMMTMMMMWLWLLQGAATHDVDVNKLDGLAKAKVEKTDITSLEEVHGGVVRRVTAEPAERGERRARVKAFVTQDIPLYHNLVMKHIPGADPELVLLNHYYEELDRIALSDMSRAEINALLDKLGFYKKSQPEEEVPEEFRFAPAKDSPFQDATTTTTTTEPPATATTTTTEPPATATPAEGQEEATPQPQAQDQRSDL
ncbi:hypothetical protein CRUP_035869 [Coryphaenoides rupestris]|nr:hypothetical protein CRUP_035869 [Coryphaenoides rupestris]